MPEKPDKSIVWLGKYMSLAMALPASVFAGFFLGALAGHFFHLPILRAAGIILGTVAGLLKVVQEVSRDGKQG